MSTGPMIRIFVLKGAASYKAAREYPAGEVLVGRYGGAEWLCLGDDPHISRRHARVNWDGSAWSIEDLGSRHGTFIEDADIRGRGAVRLLPGVVVRTGGTTWLPVPPGWIAVQENETAVLAPCARAYSHAHRHCALPLVGTLVCVNAGADEIPARDLILEVPGSTEPCRITLPALAPRSRGTLPPPQLHWRAELIERRIEPALAQVCARIGGPRAPAAGCEFVLLGARDWPCERSALRAIAAFVFPRNPVIEGIITRAAARLREAAGCVRFADLWRAGCAEPELTAMRVLYESLARDCAIRYAGPQARTAHGIACQAIATPQRVLADMPGEGTCIDLALVFAGCLEGAGFCPLVIFTGQSAAFPDHAIAGCWLGVTPGARAVWSDRAAVQREIAAGRLFVVECTGFAESAGGVKLDFQTATERAREAVARALTIEAVDVCALRPPHGTVTPLDCPMEPEVARAYSEARRLAAEQCSPAMETLHLLHGALAAGGALAAWIFGTRLSSLRASARGAERAGPGDGDAVPSQNCFLCMRIAEENAWQCGSPSVREQDLLWALIEQGARSRAVARWCAAQGVVLAEAAARLAERCPRPDRRLPDSTQPENFSAQGRENPAPTPHMISKPTP